MGVEQRGHQTVEARRWTVRRGGCASRARRLSGDGNGRGVEPWGIDQSGLRRFVNGRWDFRALPASRVANPLLAAEAQDGSLWLMGPADDLARLGPDGTFEVVRATTSRSSGRDSSAQKPGAVNPDVHPGVKKPRAVIRNLAGVDMARQVTWRDSRGRLWTFQVGANLSRSLTLVTSGRSDTVSFDVLCEDRDGNLWLGTDGRGLYCVRKQVVTAYSEPQGLVGRNVYPVLQDREGAVWFGAWSGGLSRFQNGLFTTYGAKDGLFGGSVTALAEDREGRLWVASHGGIQTFRDGRFPPALPQSSRWTPSPRHSPGWGRRDLVRHGSWRAALLERRDRALHHSGWACQRQRAGHHRLGGRRAVAGRHRAASRACATERSRPSTVREGLPASMVRALYEDRTACCGLAPTTAGWAASKRQVHALHDEGRTLQQRRVPDSRGRRGSFWMSCNRGIYRVRKQELNEFAAGQRRAVTSVAYGKSDGMVNAECNGGLWPAGIKTRDGKLWFPTQDGVAVIDPATVATNPQPPPVVIEACRSWTSNRCAGRRSIGSASGSSRARRTSRFKYTASEFHQLGAPEIQIQARRVWTRIGSRRGRGARLTIRTFRRAIHLQRDRRQQRRRVEHRRPESAHRRAAAVLSHLVVSHARRRWRCGRVSGRVQIPRRAARTAAGRAAGLLAPADRIAGGRAQTHRRRTARQPGPESAGHQEPRAAPGADAPDGQAPNAIR